MSLHRGAADGRGALPHPGGQVQFWMVWIRRFQVGIKTEVSRIVCLWVFSKYAKSTGFEFDRTIKA